jgi:tetratricopeptide (TPR) repeat protein
MKKVLPLIILILWPAFVSATTSEEYYAAGLRLFKDQDYEKSIKYFQAALEQKSDYWQAYQYLGEAYYMTANRTEAVAAMEKSLRLHPDNPELRRFVERVRETSPWDHSTAYNLSILATLLASLSLGWTFYLSRKLRRRNLPPHT